MWKQGLLSDIISIGMKADMLSGAMDCPVDTTKK